jgi:hypothetical protein
MAKEKIFKYKVRTFGLKYADDNISIANKTLKIWRSSNTWERLYHIRTALKREIMSIQNSENTRYHAISEYFCLPI